MNVKAAQSQVVFLFFTFVRDNTLTLKLDSNKVGNDVLKGADLAHRAMG